MPKATTSAETSRASSLLALLDQVEGEDLDQIDGEIATMQTRLDALQQTRKLIAKRLGVEQARPQAAGGGAAGQTEAAG